MAQDTLLGFPAHTFPYRRGEFTTLSTVSNRTSVWTCGFFSDAPFQSRFPVVYCCQDKFERGIVCTRRNAEKRF